MIDEKSYVEGRRSAFAAILEIASRELDGKLRSTAKLTAERARAVSQLRVLCEEIGDNDWDDDLHLADVIEKHILRHLER